MSKSRERSQWLKNRGDHRFGYVLAPPKDRADATPAYFRYVEWCQRLGIEPATLHRYEALDPGARTAPPIGLGNNR